MEVKYLQETEREIRKAVSKLKERKEQRRALVLAACCLKLMERKQMLEIPTREVYHATVTAVYDYLRRNKQVQRNVGPFDREVKDSIEQVLSRLLVEYGNRKD